MKAVQLAFEWISQPFEAEERQRRPPANEKTFRRCRGMPIAGYDGDERMSGNDLVFPAAKPLLTVEFQTEVDIETGNREKRMFVKMYLETRDSGLLAAIPDREWKTLCALATHMKENGKCHPTQYSLAKTLGISRETVNRRIQKLLAFRFQGHAIVAMSKNRKVTAKGGRWDNNVYHLHRLAGFGIFDAQAKDGRIFRPPEPQKASVTEASHRREQQNTYVTGSSHRHVVEQHHIGSPSERHTNQTQELTRPFNVNESKNSLKRKEEMTSASAAAECEEATIVDEIIGVCGDPWSRPFYRLIAHRVPHDLIRAALSETKYALDAGRIKKSPGAFFTDELKRIAKERGIDLSLDPDEPRAESRLRPSDTSRPIQVHARDREQRGCRTLTEREQRFCEQEERLADERAKAPEALRNILARLSTSDRRTDSK